MRPHENTELGRAGPVSNAPGRPLLVTRRCCSSKCQVLTSTGGKFLPAPRMQEEPPRSTLPQTHLGQQTAPSQLLGQRQGVSDKDIPLRQHHWGWGRGLGIPHPPASPVTGAAGSVFLLPVTTVSLCPAAQDSLSGSQPGAAPLGGATGRARGRGWLPPCPLEFAVWG